MAKKPEIQYIGQFYVYGSTAKKFSTLRLRKPKTQLPLSRPDTTRKIYVDPVAVVGILVAVVMLCVLVMGAFQITEAWNEYETMDAYVSQLKHENRKLEHTYRTGYNIEEIETTALALGMIPATEAQSISISVTVPEPEQKPTVWENIVWFVQGLLE